MIVKPGLEVLRENYYAPLRDLRVGLMTNPSAVDRDLNSAYQILSNARGVNLVALFAPEHGFAATAPDGELIGSQIDARTGLPVYSLFGDSYRPLPDVLKNMDMIVCDIQDIGVRYYTFTWTISHLLEAAGEHGVGVMILDRPNPLGGEIIEGPLLEPDMASLVGRYPVPVRYGLTLGEMAQMVNATWNPTPAALTVIPCQGWERAMLWENTGLTWVAPSPNMPHLSTLWQYPGACLIEGTTLSEGRGTTLPFEIVGAPLLNGYELAERLNTQGWPGVRFRPHSFRPSASKWAGEDCSGVQVYITQRALWRPIETWLGIIMIIDEMFPQRSIWLPPEDEVYHFDRLIGSETTRMGIEIGVTLDKLTWSWPSECDSFRQKRQPFLLYE